MSKARSRNVRTPAATREGMGQAILDLMASVEANLAKLDDKVDALSAQLTEHSERQHQDHQEVLGKLANGHHTGPLASKVTEAMARDIIASRQIRGESAQDIADRYNVSTNTIYSVCSGRTHSGLVQKIKAEFEEKIRGKGD